MKAVKLYEPGNLQVETAEVPKISDNEVLIRVKAVGICGSDIPRALEKGAYYQGLTLGHEFAGEIVECGAKVAGWETGNRVTVAPLLPCYECEYCQKEVYALCETYSYYGSRTDGAMAHYIKVDPKNLLLLPDEVSYEAGAMVDPAANAVHGIWRGKLKSGDVAVVFGLGAIGLFSVQFAKEMGASKVVAIDIFDEKLEIAKQIGADIVINSMNEDPIQVLADYNVDFVIDTSGSPIAQSTAVALAGKLSRVVFLGISNRELTLSKEAVDRLLRHEMEINGSWNSFSSPFPGKEWTYAIEKMAEGSIQTELLISHRFPLEETPAVFEKIKNKEIVFNKILILPED
ncbi:galactitol-1-phosphate 5-dehydrogenase [Alkalicoccobacillus porphyridii]|uniref:Galactitol-1-phosphate 5-dehydrogenase n=1 Tax=Alkalicoccobacillus porphyridii TaxID=2597270 RepID=A0A554A4B3_9BACI|nr:galactitol-1-phosphate 5-dehydrogenase [Alkalicoccobacillus porphyridii]TSB48521.1 galactitol-1-phosphate 5-dehydrogenase [Alkalicoccobacillus porphyridii]